MSRPLASCGLCKAVRLLCSSHLLAAAFYKPLRKDGARNPNPVILSQESTYTTSKQMQEYLLCEECEHRLKISGEDWMMTNSYWGPGQPFAFRDVMLREAPVEVQGVRRVYACAQVPSLDMDKLVYFAASVFWRAGACAWKRDLSRLPVCGTRAVIPISPGQAPSQIVSGWVRSTGPTKNRWLYAGLRYCRDHGHRRPTGHRECPRREGPDAWPRHRQGRPRPANGRT